MLNRRSILLALVAVSLLSIGSHCTPGVLKIFVLLPISDQVSLSESAPPHASQVDVKFLLPPGAQDLLVTVDGEDVTDQISSFAFLFYGNVAVEGVGEHEIEVTATVGATPALGTQRWETIALDNPDECEVLNDASCLIPYPSNRFAGPDPTTGTGLRLDIPASGLAQPNGPALDPGPYNELDGYSPMAQVLMHFPAGVDLAASDAAVLLEPGCCGQPAGPPWIDTRTHTDRSIELDFQNAPTSPTLLVDADSGELIRHFVELDARAAGNPARQVLILRPAESLIPNHRYIVAVRNLVDPSGDAVEAEVPFEVLRDRRWTTIPAIHSRIAHYEWDIFPRLASAGVARDDLILAFDFTTQSEDQLTRQMLAMRDQAYAWLADREAELVPGDPLTETFSVDSVTDHDCSVPGTVLRRIVAGTFQSPLFLDGDLAGNGVQFMNVDADDIPVQNPLTPVHHANYTIGIPCTLVDADPGNDPARPLILGHGLFGTGASMVTAIPGVAAETGLEFPYIAGATDWRGLSSVDLAWLGFQIIGIGSNQFNNFPAFPDRLRQGMLNTLVLARMMKHGFFNNNAAFQLPGSGGVFPGAAEDEYYYGISLGGIMGTFLAALTPDVERFGVDVPGINFSLLLQRSTQFVLFEALLNNLTLTDPIDQILGLGLFHDLWVSAEPAGYARHITQDPLPGSGDAAKILMSVAFLDKQVSNQASEIMARTLGLPNLTGSIIQGMRGIPDVDTDVAGPQDSAMVIWDTGSFDILDPAQAPEIPALANQIPTGTCDPHNSRPSIPASVEQLLGFLQPGGQIVNTCEGAGKLCDATELAEISLDFDLTGPPDPCFPYVP